MTITVADVMTTPVVTVRIDTSFKQVVASTRAARVSAVPVTDDSGMVLGIVTEAELLAREVSLARGPGERRRGPKVTAASAGRLMTAPAVTIRSEARAAEAARLMQSHRVPSLPVVDASGRLIGIVSRGDVLGLLTRPDAAIRREIVQDVILKGFVLDPRAFTVGVRDGIVTLAGRAESDSVGRSLVDAIRRIDGVIDVHDLLGPAQPPARRPPPGCW